MKAKILCIGLFITGFIAACGVTDSKKTQEPFNPHVDGVWGIHNMVSVVCNDDKPNEVCYHYEDFYYVSVDYPTIHTCFLRANPKSGQIIKRKEELEVAHTNENFYKIKTVNGDTVSSDTLTIKMDINEYGGLEILKKLPGEGLDGLTYSSANETANLSKEDYQQCMKNATDSKDALHFELEN